MFTFKNPPFSSKLLVVSQQKAPRHYVRRFVDSFLDSLAMVLKKMSLTLRNNKGNPYLSG